MGPYYGKNEICVLKNKIRTLQEISNLTTVKDPGPKTSTSQQRKSDVITLKVNQSWGGGGLHIFMQTKSKLLVPLILSINPQVQMMHF